MLSELYATLFWKLRGKGLGFGVFNKVHALLWQRWLRPDWIEIHGFRMYLPKDDTGFSQVLEMGETFEPEVVASVRRLARPGMTVLDVGANLGYYTLLASRLVGPSGKVVAVEPELLNIQYLTRNILENGCTNVLVAPYAAGDALKTETLYLSPSSRSGHSLVRPKDGAVARQKAVMVTLDELLPHALYPQLVKMDIEGAESIALDGMRKILEDRRLEAIIIECNKDYLAMRGQTPEALLGRLREKGFTCRALDRDNYLAVREP
jgi:FkbM family methyltransferase